MKNPSRVSYLREVLLAVVISTLAQPTFASSCYTVKLTNNSSETLYVSWGAQGCAGIDKYAALEICTSKDVATGSTASYGYLWGTTLPTVWVYPPGYEYTVGGTGFPFQYSSYDDAFEALPSMENARPETVPGCNRSYLIYISDRYLYKKTNGNYGTPPASATNVSVTKTQLPLPGGGTSDCIQKGTEATLLSNYLLYLKWQLDGNLMLYTADKAGVAVWASGTDPDATHMCFQGDGNLVIYRSSHGSWATGTNPSGNELRLQDDCNLVIYDANGGALWATGTNFACTDYEY